MHYTDRGKNVDYIRWFSKALLLCQQRISVVIMQDLRSGGLAARASSRLCLDLCLQNRQPMLPCPLKALINTVCAFPRRNVQDNLRTVSEYTERDQHELRPGESLGVRLGLVNENLDREEEVTLQVSACIPCPCVLRRSCRVGHVFVAVVVSGELPLGR